jgi:hypothetical protein
VQGPVTPTPRDANVRRRRKHQARGRNPCNVPDAAAPSSHPPHSLNISIACSGRTPSASPTITIVFAEIERISSSLRPPMASNTDGYQPSVRKVADIETNVLTSDE